MNKSEFTKELTELVKKIEGIWLVYGAKIDCRSGKEVERKKMKMHKITVIDKNDKLKLIGGYVFSAGGHLLAVHRSLHYKKVWSCTHVASGRLIANEETRGKAKSKGEKLFLAGIQTKSGQQSLQLGTEFKARQKSKIRQQVETLLDMYEAL